jgi:hypothetical protein
MLCAKKQSYTYGTVYCMLGATTAIVLCWDMYVYCARQLQCFLEHCMLGTTSAIFGTMYVVRETIGMLHFWDSVCCARNGNLTFL